MKAIWKDSAIQFSASTNYVIEAAGQGVYSGRCDMLPDGSCEVLSNKLCQYYVYQDFPLETGVNVNANACKTFVFKDFSGNTVGSDDYICDWSYEDIEFAHNTLSKPVNGHLDPRMRLLFSAYNESPRDMEFTTDGEISAKYFVFNNADNSVVPPDITAYTISWETNYDEVYYGFYHGNYELISSGSTTATGITLGLPFSGGDVNYIFEVYTGETGEIFVKGLTFYVSELGRYRAQYLTFRALEDGTEFWCKESNVYYSTDSGQTWTGITSAPKRFQMNSGDTVMFKCERAKHYNCFSGRTGTLDIEGNIMSMVYGDDFALRSDLPSESASTFNEFFSHLNVVSAVNLVLPATALTEYCYQYMFSGCTALTQGPVTLPAEVMQKSCYWGMFAGCTALTTAPELPAMTLAYGCYGHMFENCRSLATAPELPATHVADTYAYNNMFKGCSSLRIAPDLPSTEWLIRHVEIDGQEFLIGDYDNMFSGCTILSYVYCMAEGFGVNSTGWLQGVGNYGTFVKRDTRFVNGPSNWTTIII